MSCNSKLTEYYAGDVVIFDIIDDNILMFSDFRIINQNGQRYLIDKEEKIEGGKRLYANTSDFAIGDYKLEFLANRGEEQSVIVVPLFKLLNSSFRRF